VKESSLGGETIDLGGYLKCGARPWGVILGGGKPVIDKSSASSWHLDFPVTVPSLEEGQTTANRSPMQVFGLENKWLYPWTSLAFYV
jgi:hypothetical protein